MRRPPGLTLLEAIVATALAVVLGFVMLGFIKSSLAAHRRGQLGRTAQAGTRSLVSLLVGELRSASVPPLSSPVVSTPVFWPGVWGAVQEGGSALGAFYPREEVDDAGKKRDQSTNRLFYVRSAESSDETNLDPLARYALVELLVPEGKPGVIERRVHALTPATLLRLASGQGADGTPHQAWMLATGPASGSAAPTTPDILFDAGPDSRIAFRVSHLQFAPSSDPGRTRYPEPFDPGVFRVEVLVAFEPQLSSAVNQPWPSSDQWEILRSETTELRIPAVRSNQ